MTVSEEKALNAGPSGIEIAYERIGDAGAPRALLIMGGGAQMIAWPDAGWLAPCSRYLASAVLPERPALRGGG